MLKIRGETFIQQSSNTKLIKKSAIIELSTFTSIFFPINFKWFTYKHKKSLPQGTCKCLRGCEIHNSKPYYLYSERVWIIRPFLGQCK